MDRYSCEVCKTKKTYVGNKTNINTKQNGNMKTDENMKIYAHI